MAEQKELLCGLDGAAISTGALSQAIRALDPQSAAVIDVELVDGSETQTGASHSGVLRLSLKADASQKMLFIKKVAAAAMAHKAWPDLRRNLAYARTEARFYLEFAQELTGARVRLPRCAAVDVQLADLLGDSLESSATAEEPAEALLCSAGAVFLLECAEPSQFTQAAPLSEAQAAVALCAVARLHAAAWQRRSLLERVAERLQPQGGSFALSMRNPEELRNICQTWEAFANSFRESDPALFARPSVSALGERLERCALWVAAQLAPKPADPFATLIHGDLKAMNVMLPATGAMEGAMGGAMEGGEAEAPPDGAMLIDFASSGVGLGMSDVAMLLTHSVMPETLAHGGRERLLSCYMQALHDAGVLGYSEQAAMRHYHIAHVDYARFVIGRFWPNASLDGFSARAEKRNVTLPNRNVAAALHFIERTDYSLRILEEAEGPFPSCHPS